MVLVRAGTVTGTGTISASGADAYQDTPNDGGGGGGAGGTIVVTALSGGLGGLTARADGGLGGDAWRTQPPGPGNINAHGPGGGGGGGRIETSSAPGSTSAAGGGHGATTTANLVFGSNVGSDGVVGSAGSQPGLPGAAACADLSIAKTGTENAVGGAQVTYSLAVRNLGNAAATGVAVIDTLPAGATFVSASGAGWACTHPATSTVRCTRATLASGTTAPAISVVLKAPLRGGSLTDAATVSSQTLDPNPANNSASATTNLVAPPTMPDTGGSVGGPLSAGLGLLGLGLALLLGARVRPRRSRG
jgi:uncharacterized repeat protein (TIGR01451 family)